VSNVRCTSHEASHGDRSAKELVHNWQRASFDSVVVVGAFFGPIVIAPQLSKFRPRNWITAGALAVAILIFAVMLVDSFRYANRMLYRIQILEEEQPPL
jgi:hypothetical protein